MHLNLLATITFVLLASSTVLLVSSRCLSTSKKTRLADNYHPHSRFPRSSSRSSAPPPIVEGATPRNLVSAYLDGGEHLRVIESRGAGVGGGGGENAVPDGKQRQHSTNVFPKDQFTVSVRVKPEGGQFETAVLLELSDVCSEEQDGHKRVTVQLGISTESNNPSSSSSSSNSREQGASFYATLKTEMLQTSSTLWSVPYKANTWTHLVLTYDGEKTSLYENGARVAVSRKQAGSLFSIVRSHCKHLFLGSSSVIASSGLPDEELTSTNSKSATPIKKTSFRGFVDDLFIWNRALSHDEVVRIQAGDPLAKSELTFVERFENLDQWELIGGVKPRLIDVEPSEISRKDNYEIKIHPCGQTICDDPNIISNYAGNSNLRMHKTLRYRIVNIFDTDGRNPSVTPDQIRIQHDLLNRAFASSNISWRMEVIELHSTTLRRKTIVFGCDSSKIGNKQCNLECRHPITGNDGGDCDDDHQDTTNGRGGGGSGSPKCQAEKMKGNRRCDSACNRPEFNWDWGECCNGTMTMVDSSTCIDPQSPMRAYVGIDEYKRILNFTNEDALTITFADWSNNELIGLSTFPWEKEVFTIYGGVVLQPRRFGVSGHRENLVHEIGHALGLWHVHHGVSEMNCDDPCREIESSLVSGDLCADTRPTPKNMECKDPNANFFGTNNEKRSSFSTTSDHHQCESDQEFTDTPFKNYMSYSGEDCTDHFTRQQTARMHCYIDLMYRSWRVPVKNHHHHPPSVVKKMSSDEENVRLSVIPLAPRITAAHSGSITLAWIPPIGYRGCTPPGTRSAQITCTDDGRVIQYAWKAYSANGQSKVSGYWAPHQAIGPPDSEPCEASTKAWLPDATSCDEPSSCQLSLEFESPIVVETLSLWSAWNAADGIRQILLHFVDGSVESLSRPITVYCDIPYTTKIFNPRKLKKVDVYTASPFISIDAIEITSAPSDELCRECAELSYRIHRNPPFQANLPYKETRDRTFTDGSIHPDIHYEYKVQAINGSQIASDFSPALKYREGMAFCGNGKVDKSISEECDDGNVSDGDGCSAACKLEKHFACKSEPSLCYVYSGDGECEPFEETESVEDCGYYTPSEFVDQWPIEAWSNTPADSDPSCNASVLIGPAKSHRCGSTPDPDVTWRVCGSNYWRDEISTKSPPRLKLVFATPVVATSILVHLASDGSLDLGILDSKYLRLELVGEYQNRTTVHVRGSESTVLSCRRRNGLVEYPIWHDLSRPYFYTKTVAIYLDSTTAQHQIVLAGVRLRSRRTLDPLTVGRCAQSHTLYSPDLNQCLDNRCVKPECGSLNADGRVETKRCTGNRDGDTCEVGCRTGSRLVKDGGELRVVGEQSSAKIHCMNGQWSWRKVECRPVDCALPKVSHARVQCPNGTTYGQRCTFYCVSPATTKGADNSMTCGKNGVWSVPEAYCQLSCPAPSEADTHSKAINKQCRVHYKSLEAGSVTFPVGAKCKFMCKAGYHVDGQSPNKRLFRRICAENGHWLGPACVQVRCPEPKVIYAGIYNCTRGFQVGSDCSFHCPGTKEIRVSTCVSDGKWTLPEPCALPKGICIPPPIVKDIQFECAKKPYVGSMCKVSCEPYGYDAVLEHIVVTENNFKMQVLQKVNHTTCSVQKSWEPNVRSLVCVKKCAQDFVGDGWCDFQNNRGYCGWDGGDCCASTAKGGKVKLMFPTLCTSHLCQCLDPYAIENRNDLERAKLLSTDFNLPNGRSSRRNNIPVGPSILEPNVMEKAGIDHQHHPRKTDQLQQQHLELRPRSTRYSSWDLSRLNLIDFQIANLTTDQLFTTGGGGGEISKRLESYESAAREYKMLMAGNRRFGRLYQMDKIRSLTLMALRQEYKNLQVKG